MIRTFYILGLVFIGVGLFVSFNAVLKFLEGIWESM